MNDVRHFSTTEASILAGVPVADIGRWARRGTASPSRRQTEPGSLDRLRWSPAQALAAGFIGEVRREAKGLGLPRVPLKTLRRFTDAIREGAPDPITPCGSSGMYLIRSPAGTPLATIGWSFSSAGSPGDVDLAACFERAVARFEAELPGVLAARSAPGKPREV